MANPKPRSGRRSSSVRWVIVGLLLGYSFIGYVQRMNISIAAKFMMPELGLTEVQMGWIFSSFLWGYALFQVPGGFLGDAWGSRRTLTAAALICAAATLLTGWLPGLVFGSTTGAVLSMIIIRFGLGVGQAPTYPVAAATFARWFPADQWALPNALLSAGIGLGAAFTPPVVAWLMLNVGWRMSFMLLTPFVVITAGAWWWYARDCPEAHRGVSAEELKSIQSGRLHESEHEPATRLIWSELFANRRLCLITLSYLSYNYVFYIFLFWFFLYLVDVRGFSILEGGILASLPFLVGAISSGLGGWACDRLTGLWGAQVAYRSVIITCMVAASVCLLWGAAVVDPYWAVAALSLCFGFTQFTEGAFWAGAMRVGGSNTATACGVMNTGGNLGGVISTPLVPLLAQSYGWFFALATGSIAALLAAMLWLLIRVDEVPKEEARMEPPEDSWEV